MANVDLTNDREVAAVYEALQMLRVFIVRDRKRLPYSEGDVARVQERLLRAHPHMRATYQGSRTDG
jgi:hypothetical protein